MSTNVRIVLVNPTHPGNIGGAARAMKTMCLSRLYLVGPTRFPDPESTARASGADDVLENAAVCATLDQAIGGCRLVVGASARLRSLPWPALEPREAAARIAAEPETAEVAVLFGREHSGLTNDELARCQYLVHIPSNPDYHSLNIAAAVQVIAYELLLADAGREPSVRGKDAGPYATAEELEGMFQQLERVLQEIEFLDPENPRHIMRRLRRLFARTRLESTEVNILRGILTAVERRK